MRSKRTGLEKPPPPPPPARGLRFLAVALCAFVVALGFSVPHLLNAKPAYAASSCGGAEVEDTVYEGPGRSATVWVTDSYRPGPDGHFVTVGLRTWYLSHLGRCWRTYEGRVQVEDGTPASIGTQWRAWVCGQGYWQFQDGRGPQWTNLAAIVPQSAWGPGDWMWWVIPNWSGGGGVNAVWASYGSAAIGGPCNANADTYQSTAGTNTWTPSLLVSNPGPGWYASGW